MVRWRAYKSLEWFIFIGISVATFIALVAMLALIIFVRQARVAAWQPSQVPAADWQTYQNDEFGFTIQYPAGWAVDSVSTSDTPVIMVWNTERGDALNYFENVEALLIRPQGPSLDDSSITRRLETTIAGRSATVIEDVSGSERLAVQKAILFKDSGDFNIALVRRLGNGESALGALDQLERILATFQFIPVSSKDNFDGWQTYQNEKYGFEFQYPDNWFNPGGWVNYGSNIDPRNIVFSMGDRELAEYGKELGFGYAPSFAVGINEKNLDAINEDITNTETSPLSLAGIATSHRIVRASGPEGVIDIYHDITATHNNNVYSLRFSYGLTGCFNTTMPRDICEQENTARQEKSEKILMRILSTFEFIEPQLNIIPTVTVTPVPESIQDAGETVVIDFSRCQPTQQRIWVAMGSITFKIEGVDGNHCVMLTGGEVENPNWDGRLTKKCLVPISVGPRSFLKGNMGVDVSAIQQFCLEITP